MVLYTSSEFVKFDNFGTTTKTEIVITVGDPANVYDLNWTVEPDDPTCDLDQTNVIVDIWGKATSWGGWYGNDPDFDNRFPAGSLDPATWLWSPAYLLSSDRQYAGTFEWTARVRTVSGYQMAMDSFTVKIVDPCKTAVIQWITPEPEPRLSSFTLLRFDTTTSFPISVTDSVSSGLG